MTKPSDFEPGMRVVVQMNGVPDTYMATVVVPTAEQRRLLEGSRHKNEYVWVRPDPDEGRGTTPLIWKPESLTIAGWAS